MAPLVHPPAARTTRPRAHRGQEETRDAVARRRRRHVHFAAAPEWLPQPETYYPTPAVARPVTPATSLRRLGVDEVELLFSEPLPARPVAARDFAVRAIRGRDEFLLCGSLEYRKQHMGLTLWRACWAELYHGVLMLRRSREKSVEQKRKLVPIADCELAIVDFKEHVVELKCEFQGHHTRRVLRFAAAHEMFLWWWGIHVAATSPVDGRVLHKSMSRPALSPVFFLATAESAMESVFFPSAMRRARHGAVRAGEGGSAAPTKTHRSDETAAGRPTAASGPDRSYGVVHLIFVRHGEAENMQFRVNDREKKLTDRGLEQAEQTAVFLNAQLAQDRAATDRSVTLIYGGLRRTVETASRFVSAMHWLKHKYECRLLDEGAPKAVGREHRQQYRDAAHKMAFESICRWTDESGTHRRGGSGRPERPVRDAYRIVVCHASFIQFCVAQCYGVAKDVIALGAPIAHCSVTQIDVLKGDFMESEFTNRVAHLPLELRTSD
ncbi:hypothetical protein PybrP1_003697 [[Pythium] brassicae (nom. inval.)]|nr:hypothetical protein PybrP1_003697 [[Pythium] brassicae (nom. inval.)]